MAKVSLSKITTSDQNLQLLQANIQSALAAIQNSPFVSGSFLQNIALNSSTTTAVPHNLGYAPTVVVPVYNSASAVVYNSQASDAKNVYLKASAACTVNIWVG